MSDSLFRQKSIDKISAPEELNDYIKVSNPGVWMMLFSVILVLLGMVVWGTFGRLETRISVPVIVRDGEAALYVKADDLMKIRYDQDIHINDYVGKVHSYENTGNRAEDVLGDIALTEAGYDESEIVYQVEGSIDAPNGIYMGEIVIDQVSPMSFLTGEGQ